MIQSPLIKKSIRTFIIICLAAASIPGLAAERTNTDNGRSIERNLSALSKMIIPVVDFTGETSVSEAIDFLNITLQSPDPLPPRWWKIRLELPDKTMEQKLSVKGRNLHLFEILGQIVDSINAEVVVTRQGYVLRDPEFQKPDKPRK